MLLCYNDVMKYAVVNKKGVVENIVEWDGKTAYKVDGELVKTDKEAIAIGATYKDGKFTNPELPKPKATEI